MNPADTRLVAQIHQVTDGFSRLLCTLARRGKAMERDEPGRAEFLVTAVRLHPLYKGGRLAFDMLEIEDLMLDASTVDSMNTLELNQVLSAGAHNLIAVLQRIGAGAEDSRVAAGASGSEPDLLGRSDRARAVDTDVSAEVTDLPRVSFGPAQAAPASAGQSPARDERLEGIQREPELLSSDYLYDYVVLGVLDVLGGTRMKP